MSPEELALLWQRWLEANAAHIDLTDLTGRAELARKLAAVARPPGQPMARRREAMWRRK